MSSKFCLSAIVVVFAFMTAHAKEPTDIPGDALKSILSGYTLTQGDGLWSGGAATNEVNGADFRMNSVYCVFSKKAGASEDDLAELAWKINQGLIEKYELKGCKAWPKRQPPGLTKQQFGEAHVRSSVRDGEHRDLTYLTTQVVSLSETSVGVTVTYVSLDSNIR